MKRTTRRFVPVLLVCLLALLSCEEDDTHRELGRTRSELARRESELRRSQESLSAAEARAEELAAELAAARRRADRAQSETQAAESDFLGACAIAFACVVTVLLLAHVLIGERRSRKALSAPLQWIRGRRA